MKYAISILALMMPLMSKADIERESSAGLYQDCVKWTTINGIEHSKGFQYVLNEDDSMSLDILYYTGTAKCEGNGEILLHAANFSVKEKIAYKKAIFMLIAHNEDGGDYYQMMFSKDAVIINISKGLPIKYDFNRTLHLKKVQQP